MKKKKKTMKEKKTMTNIKNKFLISSAHSNQKSTEVSVTQKETQTIYCSGKIKQIKKEKIRRNSCRKNFRLNQKSQKNLSKSYRRNKTFFPIQAKDYTENF